MTGPAMRGESVLSLRRVRNAALMVIVAPAERATGIFGSVTRRRLPGASAATLGVVLAAYDVERTATVMREIVASVISGEGCRAVVVANSEAVLRRLDQWDLPRGIEVIRGSNEVGEFSAYQEGVDQLRSQERLPETLLVANDRALSYGDRFGAVLDPQALEVLCTHPMLCGTINSYGRSVPLLGCWLDTWCRTNFMLTSREALAAIGSAVSVGRAEFDSHVPVEFPGEGWSPASWLGPEYARIVLSWLTKRGNWYRAEPISEANWLFMRLKLLAIINEHLFSVRARERGVPLIGYKQLVGFKELRVQPPTFAWVIGQYRSSPFMAADSERTPALRLFQVAAVWAGTVGLDSTARSLMRRSLAQHEWDRGNAQTSYRAL